MLIYVATYPRSGSALLRRLLFLNFGLRTANGYEASHLARPTDDPAVAVFKQAVMVTEPALHTLRPSVRQRLAALPFPLLVKTHDLPPDDPLPGESAIQMVRHPGGALASLRRLEAAQSLAPYIAGDCYAGSWSAYHEAWGRWSAARLQLSYERAFADQSGTVRRLADFLQAPVASIVTHSPAAARTENPVRNPVRGPEAWIGDFSAAELAELWRVHGPTASRFGYRAHAALARTTEAAVGSARVLVPAV